MESAVLTESAILAAPEETSGGKGIWRARLIEADIQGSSGFYPASVLRRDGPIAFPAGTHVYLDHPTRSEEEERPERSVREMAGVLLDNARFEEALEGTGLYARVQFFEDVRDLIRTRAKHVGLSIRAAGEVEDTPTGRVVRSIREGLSVDVVTRAGAGGRLVTMTESAKPESPPAEQTATTAASVAASIPSTTGTGALVSEVASLKESFIDRLEQISVDLTRLTQRLTEAQREMEKQVRENQKLSEAITFLRDRQEAFDAKMKESKGNGETLIELLESKLPLASIIRIARAHRPDQDLHEEIQAEREYCKRLLREAERGALESNRESSNLGLTESATAFTSATADGDLAEIRDLLAGGTY